MDHRDPVDDESLCLFIIEQMRTATAAIYGGASPERFLWNLLTDIIKMQPAYLWTWAPVEQDPPSEPLLCTPYREFITIKGGTFWRSPTSANEAP